jgi:hypothetical protein
MISIAFDGFWKDSTWIRLMVCQWTWVCVIRVKSNELGLRGKQSHLSSSRRTGNATARVPAHTRSGRHSLFHSIIFTSALCRTSYVANFCHQAVHLCYSYRYTKPICHQGCGQVSILDSRIPEISGISFYPEISSYPTRFEIGVLFEFK